MNLFIETIRGAAENGSQRGSSPIPSTSPIDENSTLNLKNIITKNKELKKAADKGEKAFNSALNSYFKKFGLKYKDGRITVPAVDRALERTAKKAAKNSGGSSNSSRTLSDMIKIVQTMNSKGGAATINGSDMLSTNPLQPGTMTDLRNIYKRGDE